MVQTLEELRQEDERIRSSYKETGHHPSCCGACDTCLRVCRGNHETDEEYNPILEKFGWGFLDDGGLR